MADLDINISLPVLLSGQYFKVRYRKLPAGSFSGYTNYTTNSFTISGLDAESEYEVEATFYNGIEDCFTTTFTAKTEAYECPAGISAEIVRTGSIYEIVITYTDPVTGIPPCGYKIEYTQTGTPFNINLPTLPSGGEYRITIPNNITTLVTVSINTCYEIRQCFQEEVPPADTECDPIVVTGTTLVPRTAPFWQLTVLFNQSTPRTTSTTISYNQTNPTSGVPDSGFFTVPLPLSPTTSHGWAVKPTPGQGEPSYSGTITDACGNVHSWST